MHYVHLGIMTALSYIAMYLAMYAMIYTLGDFYSNINQAYMAAMMAAPMVIIELVVMRAMYPSRAANVAIILVSAIVLIAAWAAIRYQTFVGDIQFVRSMVPHHSGAILMCQEASIQDGELKKLCDQIIRSQEDEIAQMKAILARLESQ